MKIDQPFDLDAVLDGTQDFSWRPWRDDWHSGVLAGNLIHIRQIGEGIEYQASSDLDGLLTTYFRLDQKIEDIHADLSSRDTTIARLAKKHPYLPERREGKAQPTTALLFGWALERQSEPVGAGPQKASVQGERSPGFGCHPPASPGIRPFSRFRRRSPDHVRQSYPWPRISTCIEHLSVFYI